MVSNVWSSALSFEESPPLCRKQWALFTLCISVCILEICVHEQERVHSPLTKRKLKILPGRWGEKQGKLLPTVIWANVLTRRSCSKASYPRRKFMKYSCQWLSKEKKSSIMKLWPGQMSVRGHIERAAIFSIMRPPSLPEAHILSFGEMHCWEGSWECIQRTWPLFHS